MAKIGAGRKQIGHLSTRTFLVSGSTWVHFQLQSLAFLLLLLGLPLSCLTPSPSTCLVVTKHLVRVKERSRLLRVQSCGLEPWLLSRG